MSKKSLVVLAAGMATRFGSLKQLEKLGPSGESLLEYSVYDAIRAGFDQVVFIIRKEFEEAFQNQISNKFKDLIEVKFAYQDLNALPEGFSFPERVKPWGTGHALICAKGVIDYPFVVINADDYYGLNAYQKMADYLDTNPKDTAMCAYVLSNTLSDYGSVSRGVCKVENNYLVSIKETAKIFAQPSVYYEEDGKEYPLAKDCLVSMNMWAFQLSFLDILHDLFVEFLKTNQDIAKGEFSIPIIVNDVLAQHPVYVMHSEDKWYGITYKEDKPLVIEGLSKMVDEGLYPNNLWEEK